MDTEEECDICGQGHPPETCPELNHTGSDVTNTSRARATLPSQFVLMERDDSSIDVITMSELASKHHLGTFEALKTTKPIGGDTDFVLQIRLKSAESVVWLDTRDEDKCNWLCLIAVAASVEEKNVMALQVGLDIIYMTTQEIHRGEALKVWYSPSYAKRLNRPVQPDGITKSMLVVSRRIQPTLDNLLEPSPDKTEISSADVTAFHPSTNKATAEEKTGLKPTLQCGKGIYVCAHPGCALIFPTLMKLDEHTKTHSANRQTEVDSPTTGMKAESVGRTVSPLRQDSDVTAADVSLSVFQELPASTTSTLDLLINPRTLHIRHQEGATVQRCHHCAEVFGSIEELATHVKDHIFKAEGRKRKGRHTRTHTNVVEDVIEQVSPPDGVDLDRTRKSRRSRSSRFAHDPDFVYSHTAKRRRHDDQTGVPKVKTKEETQTKPEGQMVKRRRGRPPKCQKQGTSLAALQPNASQFAVTEDEKTDFGGVPYIQEQNTSQCPEEDKQMTDSDIKQLATEPSQPSAPTAYRSLAQVEDTIKCESQTEREEFRECLADYQDESHVDGKNVDLSRDIWPASEKLDSSQDTSILATEEADIIIDNSGLGDVTLEADEQREDSADKELYTSVKDENQLVSADRADAADDRKDGSLSELSEHVGFTRCPNCLELFLSADAHDCKSEGGHLAEKDEPDAAAGQKPPEVDPDEVNNEASRSGQDTGVWNTGNPSYDVLLEADDQKIVHVTSDHSSYSLKTADAGSVAMATNADSLFTSTSCMSSIVNLDDMDVITGESLAADDAAADADAKPNESKAIINKDKTHYLCTACQQERPLVSIRELEDHLYTHVGFTKCLKCDELFTSSGGHECKSKGDGDPAAAAKDEPAEGGRPPASGPEPKSDKFACGICGRLFDKEAHLMTHRKRHDSSTVCRTCHRTFTSDDQLRKHDCAPAADADTPGSDAAVGSDRKTHFCEFCGAGYKKRQYLLLHLATHTKEHKCQRCGVHFARKETLMRHWTKCMPDEVANKDVFSCDRCSRVFTKQLSLENHMRTVHTESFKCDRCQKAFASMFSMRRHACADQPAASFGCTVCPKVFRRRLYLKRHMAVHSGKFTCILCQQHYARKEELLNHMLECSASIQFETTGTITCTVCNKVYTDVHAYRLHYQHHTHPYKCDVCDKPFLRPMALEAHRKKCRPYEGEPVVCPICGKKFRSQIYLLRHKQVHDEKKYTCRQCGRKFRRIDYLNNHMCVDGDGCQVPSTQRYRKEELVTKDLCVCPHCGKTFQTTSNLNKHILLHGEKKEVCEICGKKFHLKVGLREHMKYVHTDQYLVECKVCKKRLKSRNSLYGHMAVYHSDIDTVYACDQCGKTFRQKGNLKKHALVHSDSRLFACRQCDRKFKFPEQLRRHQLWHSAGPRFYCDLCDKAFVMEFEIKKHLNTMHGGLTYICCYCKTDCHHFYSMKRHLQRRHQDKPEWQQSVNEFIRGLAIQTVAVITTDNRTTSTKKSQAHIASSVKKLFRCGFCKQIFQSQPDLQRHLADAHCTAHQFRCAYCAHACREAQDMHRHLQNEHADIEEWQADPELYVRRLEDTGSQLVEAKFAPESRSLLRDLNILKEESEVEAINPFAMTPESLDSQSILTQTIVSMATDLLGNVQQTLPQIDSQTLTLPLQGTEGIGDMADMNLDMGQEPVIVAEVKDFAEADAKDAGQSQTIVIKGEGQDIELSGVLSQEVADALQSLSVHGAFAAVSDHQTLITIADGVDSIHGLPSGVTSSAAAAAATTAADHGLIILPVMEQVAVPGGLAELRHDDLKPHVDDIGSQLDGAQQLAQLPHVTEEEMKCNP